MTLTKQNINHLLPLIQIAEELNVDRFYISHLLYSGRGEEIKKDDIDRETNRILMYQIFEIAENFLKNNKKMQFVSGGNDVDATFLYLYVLEKHGKEKAQRLWNILLQKRGNSAGEKILNIDNYGEVHPDQFWRKYSAGNILKSSLKDIQKDSLLVQLKEREKYLKDCKDCYFLKRCLIWKHGQMLIIIYLIGNGVYTVTHPFQKEIWITFSGEPDGKIQIIDTRTKDTIKVLDIGKKIYHLAFTPRGNLAFVSSNETNELIIIQTNDYQIVKKI